MPTPANRAKIQLVRGSYANILASIADLVDGELCYAKDQNKLYMVEGDTLTPLDYLGLGDVDEAVQDAVGSSLSGGTGLTLTYDDDAGTLVIDLDDTAVTAGEYGSSTAIPVITIDEQGRITAADTAAISTDMAIAGDGSTSDTISIGTDTLTFAGGTGLTSSVANDTVTFDLDDTAVIADSYGAADTVATFTVDEQGRLTAATDVGISITSSAVTDFASEVREVAGINQTFEPMGHAVRLDSQISFDTVNRIFTIQPASTSYDVWCKGVKYTKTGASSVTLPNTTGLYYIYFDTSGELQYRTTYFDWENDVPTAYVYWNATTGTAPYIADERHGITLDWATHEYLHRTRGAVIADGFSISNYTIVGDGSLDSHAQIDLSGGTFFDEDLEVLITNSNTPTLNTWEQDLQGPALIPAFYLNGSGPEWVKDAATAFPFKQGTTYPQYNLLSGGSWTTVDIDANKYAVSFILATNNLNEPIIAIIGQNQYQNIGDAEGAEFSDLILDGFPSVEFRPLYKLVFQCGDYGNNVNARLAAVVDVRQLQSAGVGQALGADHGILTGLGDDDHLQYLHTENTRTGITASITTSGTLKTTNTTDATSSSTGALVVAGGVGIGGDLYVEGDLTINGDTVTVNTETIVVEDKNIQLGTVATPSNTTANGGGITLLGGETDGDKTIQWISSSSAWTFSEHVDIASGKEYYIAGNSVLNATTLGSGITISSLTTVGTIDTGTWNGTAVGVGYGGTGLSTIPQGSVLIGSAEDTVTALDGGGSADGVLVYDFTTDAVSWSTELDGGNF